jgi:hypothetical protein
MVGGRDERGWRGEEMSHSFSHDCWEPMELSGCGVIGRWTGRQLASCPMHWGATEHEFHAPSICENVVPGHPCFVPGFTVYFQTLDVERGIAIATSCGNHQTLSITKADSHCFEPRRKNKEGGLSCHWVEPNHLPLVDHQYSVFIQKSQDDSPRGCFPSLLHPSFQVFRSRQYCTSFRYTYSSPHSCTACPGRSCTRMDW